MPTLPLRWRRATRPPATGGAWGPALTRLAWASWVSVAVAASPAAAAPAAQAATTAMATATPTWSWQADAQLPPDFPVPDVPADNPMSRAKVALGRHLFYDKQLSGNGSTACASCHFQHLAFTDGRALPRGSTGETVVRNAQGLGNVAFHSTLTWANPLLTTLERQMETPLFGAHPVEMGLNSRNQDRILARFRRDAGRVGYPAMFAAAFPDAPAAQRVSVAHIIQAISAFERTLLSGDSRYDRYQRGQATFSPAEERGLKLFHSDSAQCAQCHSGFNFSDQTRHAGSPAARHDKPPLFHNTGLYNLDGRGAFPADNRGVYETSLVSSDMGRFRAPSLRNVAVTAPYMHDGSQPTLQAVLDHYANGGSLTPSGPLAGDGRASPLKDPRLNLIRLSEQDKADLIAFLNTLTDEGFLRNPRLSDPFKLSR